MASSTIKSIAALRDELHQKLLTNPDYRALLALDRLIGEIETDFENSMPDDRLGERIQIANEASTSSYS